MFNLFDSKIKKITCSYNYAKRTLFILGANTNSIINNAHASSNIRRLVSVFICFRVNSSEIVSEAAENNAMNI